MHFLSLPRAPLECPEGRGRCGGECSDDIRVIRCPAVSNRQLQRTHIAHVTRVYTYVYTRTHPFHYFVFFFSCFEQTQCLCVPYYLLIIVQKKKKTKRLNVPFLPRPLSSVASLPVPPTTAPAIVGILRDVQRSRGYINMKTGN